MPAWSFQPRFRAALLNGLAEASRRPPPFPGLLPKRSTVRRRRADGKDPRPGQAVRVWISQRSPRRELLGETPPITRVEIEIPRPGRVLISGGRQLAPGSVTRMAHGDGFDTAADFFLFLQLADGLPLAAYWFRW